jgi:hypothetical protein
MPDNEWWGGPGNAKHYDTLQVFDAKHKKDLKRLDDVVVSVNYNEGPVGNGSCGKVEPLNKYILPLKKVSFSTYITPYTEN